jgi:NADPH:quinone reductase
MRAAMCRTHGAPEVVQIEDVDDPAVGAGQLRVAVKSAAVNFPDVLIVANDYQLKVPTPFVPGSEFAGIVAEVGEGVDASLVGTSVFGTVMVGAFGESVVASVDSVTLVPAGVDLEVAASFGVAHRTAYHVLRTVASLAPGEELIVLGAGGGVGLAAVQLGVVLGATVTAVASSQEKLDAAKACGATRLVNHSDGDLRTALKTAVPNGADVVIDPVGGSLAEPALRAMRYGGRFVTVGYASGEIPRIPLNLVLLKGVQIVGFEFRTFGVHHAEEMARNEAELMGLLGSGKVVPHVGARFELADTVAALRYVGDGRAIGKVLINV